MVVDPGRPGNAVAVEIEDEVTARFSRGLHLRLVVAEPGRIHPAYRREPSSEEVGKSRVGTGIRNQHLPVPVSLDHRVGGLERERDALERRAFAVRVALDDDRDGRVHDDQA